ncbi:MAG: CPA1 family monovalent cation:H+ antiporter [Cryomorphaceae bacterium]|jgi:CPA1 family monovalent cation:H+ antiporter
MFQTFSLIFLIASLLSVINYRWLKLPSTIGTMILALVVTVLLTLAKPLLPEVYEMMCNMIIGADFKTLLLDVMLSLLLFAGAIHVDIADLKKEKWSIMLFATLGVIISTLIVGGLLFLVAPFFGVEIPIGYAMLFGALISPTDPIAVLAILQKADISKSLELKIEGESLFNDGVGVVVFTSVLLIVGGNSTAAELSGEVLHVFLLEAVGGILFGLLLGWLSLKLMKTVKENGELVTILTLATVLGGYAVAQLIGTSGPLAMVVAGLYIGNGVNHKVLGEESQKTINGFWKILDESLNTVLFVLIGFSVHLIDLQINVIGLGFAAIVIVLIGRILSVILPFSLLNFKDHDFWKTSSVLIWGGLRGGISIALALSLPEEYFANEIFLLTFMVVLFSILAQGLSISALVRRLFSK